jgi:hypothetical protein
MAFGCDVPGATPSGLSLRLRRMSFLPFTRIPPSQRRYHSLQRMSCSSTKGCRRGWFQGYATSSPNREARFDWACLSWRSRFLEYAAIFERLLQEFLARRWSFSIRAISDGGRGGRASSKMRFALLNCRVLEINWSFDR